MTVTQTIDIPADRWLKVPNEIPMGKTIVTFTPAAAPAKRKMTEAESMAYINKHAKRLNKESKFFQELQEECMNYDEWEDDE